MAVELDRGKSHAMRGEEGLAASTDPSLMRLVLLNLVGNASSSAPRAAKTAEYRLAVDFRPA